ncbi:MAG TPA: hypothetical protein VH393_16690 [Ktedonobacterales bacterium]|jgi:hypothetical protein
MERISVPIAAGVSAEEVAAAVERIALETGPLVRIRRTLKQNPGGAHWHLATPDQPGTLEVTHWPQTGELWLSIHDNRRASWITRTAPHFSQKVSAQLT